MFEEFGINAGFVEDLHARYQQSPQSVDEEWRSFFQARDRGDTASAPGTNRTNGAHSVNGNGAAAYAQAPAARQGVNGNGAHAPSVARDDGRLAAAAVQGRVY